MATGLDGPARVVDGAAPPAAAVAAAPGSGLPGALSRAPLQLLPV